MINFNSGESPVPVLTCREISLVPLRCDHIPTLHKWESDASSLYLWTFQRRIISEDEYREVIISRMRKYYHVFFIIEIPANKPIGFIYSHDVNLVDGFISMTAFLEPVSRGHGFGIKAGILFCNYFFTYYPLRKIYCEVFEYNKESLSLLKHAGFVIEGKFEKHRFFRGKYWALYRLALYQEKFFKRFDPVIKKFVSAIPLKQNKQKRG